MILDFASTVYIYVMLANSHTSPTFMECMRYGKSALHLSNIIFIYNIKCCWYQVIGMPVSQIF